MALLGFAEIQERIHMSANNWAVCPKCKQVAEAAKAARGNKAAASYGQVSPEEYVALLEQAQAPMNLGTTLREDYEIGIRKNGEFFVSYGASCEICGFDFQFDEQRQVANSEA